MRDLGSMGLILQPIVAIPCFYRPPRHAGLVLGRLRIPSDDVASIRGLPRAPEIKLFLQPQPKLCRIAKIGGKTERHFRTNPNAPTHQLGNLRLGAKNILG